MRACFATSRFVTIVCAALQACTLFAQTSFAQANNGVTSPTGASGPPIGMTGNGRSLPAGSDSAPPVFLSGSVTIDDASRDRHGIPIQTVCSNDARTVAWTDSQGHFSFQWTGLSGNSAAGSATASESGSRNDAGVIGILPRGGNPSSVSGMNSGPSTAIVNCEIRAAAPGFRSDSISLANHRATDHPDLGAIVLHRLSKSPGARVSAASLSAPKSALQALNRGRAALHDAKPDLAVKEFEKAVALYPKYAEAWLDLGRARAQKQLMDAARAAFEKAAESDPAFAAPWFELGILAGREQNWDQCARFVTKGLQLDAGGSPQSWYVAAMAHYYLAHYDEAEKSVREALHLDPAGRNPRAGYVLGMVLAQKRDYASAAVALKNYLAVAPHAPDAPQVKAQLAEIESFRAAAVR